MKQTAVNFLEDCIDKYEKWISGHYEAEAYSLTDLYNDIEQAKEMEKQQIIDARVNAPLLNTGYKSDYVIEAEQYYNETFKK
jgi:hypothetical protein